MSRLEAHASSFRLLMKGIFDPNVLWLFDKKLISYLLVTRVSTRNSTVDILCRTNTEAGLLNVFQKGKAL